jgi:hypothetical protein
MNAWIERQRGLIDFTVANLARRKGRNLGLFLAYALLVFLLASVVLFGDGLRREARLLLADAPELVVQRLTAGRHDLAPEAWLEQLRGLRGVAPFPGGCGVTTSIPRWPPISPCRCPPSIPPRRGASCWARRWPAPGAWQPAMCCPCAITPESLMPLPSEACWMPAPNWFPPT